MRVAQLYLKGFRDYTDSTFEFGPLTLIQGFNGAGKSNILEALYLLATGKSFRAETDSEMILYGQQVAHIQGVIDTTQLHIVLTDGSAHYGRKKFTVNGVARRQMDFVGKLRAVLFSPTDMELLTGSPSKRRKYLDFVLSQRDREYRRCLQAYEKGLRQRNKLLDLIRDGLAQRSQLFFWDKTLIKNGEYITYRREMYLQGLQNDEYQAVYDKSIISEYRLQQYEKEEVAAGTTLVGPHRDDFWVAYKGKDISKFGSRGEQRMAVLWLKIGEWQFLTIDDELPVLLLDDIFSELDISHRNQVMKLVHEQKTKGGQVVMTSAEDSLGFKDQFDALILL